MTTSTRREIFSAGQGSCSPKQGTYARQGGFFLASTVIELTKE